MSFFFCHLGLDEILKEDMLIRRFGFQQIGRLGTQKKQRERDIHRLRNKLKILAMLCQNIRQLSGSNHSMYEYIRPQYFKMFLRATKQLTANAPSLALHIEHHIKQLVMLKMSESVAKGVQLHRVHADEFKDLIDANWRTQFPVLTPRGQLKALARLSQGNELPTAADLVKATEYIKEKISAEANAYELSKLCLALLILFNKRKSTDVAELRKEDFKTIHKCQKENADVIKSLDNTEKALANRYCLVGQLSW